MRLIGRVAVVVLSATALVGSTTVTSFAASGDAARGGAVFVHTDDLQHNAVVSFVRDASGALHRVGAFRTGGAGGVEHGVPLDSLASQDSLTYDARHHLLFAVNAGSNTVSSFAVDGASLRLRQIVRSGGEFPVSVAVRAGRLYVLNAGGSGNVSGYRVNHVGRLTPLRGASRDLGLDNTAVPDFITAPADIAITPDGAHVVVTTKANNTIDVFNVRASGNLSPPIRNLSAADVPFAVAFDPSGRLVVANAGASTVSTYTVHDDGTLTTITAALPDGQAALCWIVGTGGVFFGANAGSSTISAFAVDSTGNASLTGTPDGVVASTGGGSGGTIDLALTRDSRLLYAQNSLAGTVEGYRLNPDHTLTLVSSVAGLPRFDGHGMEGLVAL